MEKYRLKDRVERMALGKVNSFSPTISPAPKDVERREIESVGRALKYYYKRGVTEFVAQKKYMGSYCDIYLHSDIDQSYIVSRNGYLITHLNREDVIGGLADLHHKFDWSEYKVILIQSELMPWSTMGKGLIDNDFSGYLDAHRTHKDYLQSSGLYDKLDKVKSSVAYRKFEAEYDPKSVKNLKKKYPSYVIRQYKAVHDLQVHDLEDYQKNIELYQRQIDHYGNVEPLSFKPFNILKMIAKDDSEVLPNDNHTYKFVNDDAMLELSINSDAELEAAVDLANGWLNQLTGEMEEGIMIKPRVAFIPNLPPAFKVRNNDYLTMIYGVDFIPDYDRYIKRRRISRKIDCSINDWMQNWELLQIPLATIDSENYHYKNLICDRILGEMETGKLDSRL